MFNLGKCHVKQPEVSFFGNIYSKDGIRPKPARVQSIDNMPAPGTEDLQTLLGMVTYLAIHPQLQ